MSTDGNGMGIGSSQRPQAEQQKNTQALGLVIMEQQIARRSPGTIYARSGASNLAQHARAKPAADHGFQRLERPDVLARSSQGGFDLPSYRKERLTVPLE